jgi:hypothetical protein
VRNFSPNIHLLPGWSGDDDDETLFLFLFLSRGRVVSSEKRDEEVVLRFFEF